MTYFLKKKKWMAWVVLLTFLFTSFMPTNLLTGNSVASAEVTAEAFLKQVPTNMQEISMGIQGNSTNSHFFVTRGWVDTEGCLYVEFCCNETIDKATQSTKLPYYFSVGNFVAGDKTNKKANAIPENAWFVDNGVPKFIINVGNVLDNLLDNNKLSVTSISNADGYSLEGASLYVTSIYVKKVWDDNDNRTNNRPESIQVQLKGNNSNLGDNVTLNETNEWTYIWRDYKQDDSISYTVEEVETPEGYITKITGNQENGFTITNTLETVAVSGTKTWNDADDQDGKRPESITVKLMNGTTEVASQEVTADNNWAYSFKNLPRYANGQKITYTVKEVAVDGYTSEVNGYDITNTHTPEKISVSGNKTWVDNNNQDGKRPGSITVKLMNGTTEVASQEVTADNNWAYSFTNLPRYANGQEITYTVKEVAVDGYTSEVNGYDITNTHTPEKISVSGNKTWVDNNNQDGKRPESITVKLMNGTTEVVSQEVTADNNWAYSFTNLPRYANGQEITYTVEEVAVDGYTSEVNGYDITNTHTPEKISVSGNKTWVDNNNQDGKRPESITVKLMNGTTEVASQEVTADNNWAYSFTNLPRYANGQEITYTVEEVAVDGYTSEVNGYDITNTHTPEKISVSGNKTWVDNNNQDGKRPESITVKLMNGTTEVASQEVTADNNWAYSFTNLPRYANGQEITYTVKEVAVDGYTSEVNGYDITNTHTPETVKLQVDKTWVGDKNDNMNLIFNRPDTLTFTITGKVGTKTVSTDTVTMTVNDAVNTQTVDVKKTVGETPIDLPKYYQGQLITYTIEETVPEGYTVDYTGGSHNWTWQQPSLLAVLFSSNTENAVDHVFKVTNTLVTCNFKMTKEYSGTEPANDNKAKFTLTVVAPENTPENNRIAASGEIAVGTNGNYTFSNLKYGVTYRVEETTPNGYEKADDFYLKVVKDNNNYVVKAYSDSGCENEITSTTENWKVENGVYTLTNVVKTADLSFEKKFDSVIPNPMPTFTAENQNNKVVAATDGKTYTFNNLECGTYTVVESTVPGYEAVSFQIQVTDPGVGKSAVASVVADSGKILPVADANGDYTLTNIAKTTSLTLSKTYNGIETGHATFTITEEDEENPMAYIVLKDGLYTFSGLQYGKSYTVVENAPLGYVGVKFTIDVAKTDDNGDPIAEINGKVDGLTEGSQSAGYDYALENKVKTTGFSFNKVFEENRNTTTPSFVAIELSNDGNETDNKVNFTYTSKGAGETITHQYSTASDALQYGKKYRIVETNTPAGYETATPFEITIDLDGNSNAVAKVTKFGEDFENGVLTNYLKAAKYEIHYHYQQLEETAQADYLGKYAYKEEGTVKTVPAKVGDQINFNNLTDEDKDSSKHVTTSSVYVFNAEKTETDNKNKIVVENVDGAKTVLNVYFDLRFAVQYHWKGADKKIHDDNTINEPKYDLTLNDVVNLSDNKAPNTDATPDNPWYLFNGQWYATTQQAFDWNFDNAQQWLLEEDKVDKENILTYVKNNVLHLYAAWNAKPAAAGNINVSKTVTVVDEKEGNTDRDKLFDFALDLYVTTGSGLTFEQAKANTTSPSAIDFKVTITDKDGKTVDRVPTLREIGNGIYQYLFQLKDGENASFDLKAVASTGSALIWFQLDETSAGEDVGFTTELTGEESAVSGLSGIGCVDENGVYTFGYVNTFTYEADKPTDPEDPTDPERPRDPSDPREPDVDIEDPDVPLAEPDEPPIEIEDPDVPLTDVPGEPIEIDEPEVPLGDAPKTGDSSNAIPFVILMMVGITGLAITRRKFN